MSDDAPERDYEVGYGKPPAATRFAPGRSGNPRGREKGSKNGKALLKAELQAVVVLIENGKRIKTTKEALIVKQAVNKAAKGDVKTLLALAKHYGWEETAAKIDEIDADPDSEEDAQTYESFIKRLKGNRS